jgi:DNA-binding IclR family transcriptional regulator
VASPPADRVIQVLQFLTTHPGGAFTLSDLSRHLSISKGTAHSILGTLTERAILTRNPATNEYRLGPALIPVGAVAERGFPALAHARREAEALVATCDAECLILMPGGDDLLSLGRVGTPGPLSAGYVEGQRHPFVPPFGAAIVAWQDDDAVAAWLDRSDPPLPKADRTRLVRALATIRAQGYAVARRVPGIYDLYELYGRDNHYTLEGRRQIAEALTALARDKRYLVTADSPPADAELSTIETPVFDHDGVVLFIMCIVVRERTPVSEAPGLARALTRAAGNVMVAIDGRPPIGGRSARRGR